MRSLIRAAEVAARTHKASSPSSRSFSALKSSMLVRSSTTSLKTSCVVFRGCTQQRTVRPPHLPASGNGSTAANTRRSTLSRRPLDVRPRTHLAVRDCTSTAVRERDPHSELYNPPSRVPSDASGSMITPDGVRNAGPRVARREAKPAIPAQRTLGSALLCEEQATNLVSLLEFFSTSELIGEGEG